MATDMNAPMKDLIDKLEKNRVLNRDEFVLLLSNFTPETGDYLFQKARCISKRYFDNKIYVRGLIEFTNYCKNDCLYCGIRRSNSNAERYRLGKNEIMACCKKGYSLGFRTFVLQGGEDLRYTTEDLTGIVSVIRHAFPDCAITLSVGEKSYEEYLEYYEAGANRYLLRHETADLKHYGLLHTKEQSAVNRQRCLYDLKKIGYQVGAGFMVGSPYQTMDNIAEDLFFLRRLEPEMIGIGPFIPHRDTPFKGHPSGSLELTLLLLGMLRLMFPNALIPATTALGTIAPNGRELGILAGANVVMPNLSPVSVRKKYLLYDNKICTGEEAAECRFCLQNRMKKIGYEIVVDRGDFRPLEARQACFACCPTIIKKKN